MADKKVTELTAITNLSGDDLLLVVNDPLGTPDSRKVTLTNFFANVAVSTVHTATSTFRANTTFNGTKITMGANLMFTGASSDAYSMIKDRYQVANVDAKFYNSNLTGNTVIQGLYSSNTMFLKVNIAANTPLTTNAASEVVHGSGAVLPKGTVWWANSSMYVATSNYDVKKVQLFHRNTHVRFDMSFVGNTAWTISGGGASGANNETLYLYKGFGYEFRHPSQHPLQIQYANGQQYSTGWYVEDARTKTFIVPQNQSSNLYYQCTTHAAMKGTIVIV